jgi:UbiD family decarboxylase
MQFGDLRGWIAQLKRAGELHEIDAEVDWDCGVGTVTMRAFGNGDGPALLFNNIKDYRHARCTKLFIGGLSNYSRVAMMFGLSKKASITDLVRAARKAYSGRLPPVKVATGPVKENIVTGDDINLYDFPVPRWHLRNRQARPARRAAPPVTSYSETSGGTGEEAQNGRHGSQP